MSQPLPSLDPQAIARRKIGEKLDKFMQQALPPEADPDAVPFDIPWQPTRNHVIVRRVRRTKSESGRLVLPDNIEAEENVGMVEAAGPAVADPAITRGAFVLLGEWGGTRVNVVDPATGSTKTLLVLEDEEVLAVWQEPEVQHVEE